MSLRPCGCPAGTCAGHSVATSALPWWGLCGWVRRVARRRGIPHLLASLLQEDWTPSQEAVCLERSLDLDLPAFSRWHGYGTLTGHWLSLSLSFPDRGAESWTISRVCSSSPSSGFDSDCLCPTPDSILVTSLLPQSLGLEVSPYFLASWDLTLMVGFCRGTGGPKCAPFSTPGVSKLPAF